MSDDRIQHSLDAYADHLQRSAELAPAAQIRRRAVRRRRNQAAGTAFAAVLIAALGLGTILNRAPEQMPNPAAPPASPPPSRVPSGTSTVTSNVTQLRQFGIDLQTDVLIDVADDGVDRWMQIGADDAVDFTGTAKDDSTRMVLLPAPVTTPNRVMISAAARPGFCVTATPQPPLALQPCRDGDQAQTWHLLPAGDSGQFNLQGPYGVMTVDEALVPSGQSGRTGLQTIRFDK
jgi:hypothetical protein